MLYLMAFAVAIVIIVYVGTFLHRQATLRQAAQREAGLRGSRRKTNHLRKIRTKVRGGKHQDRARRRPDA